MNPTEATHGNPTSDQITFLVLGGQRCGSTWLHKALKEHPEIFLPASKGIYFFDESFHNGMNWYLKHFRGITKQHKAVGEVATGYSLPHAIRNMSTELPEIKIVMAMRNPTERTNSYYRSRAPHENWRNLSQALEEDPSIVTRGQYVDQMSVLLEHYPRDKILFLLFDDLCKGEAEYISRLYEFLGVDPAFRPSVIGNPVRAAMFPNVRRWMKLMGLNFLVDLINYSWIGDALRRTVRKQRKVVNTTQKMPGEIRDSLVTHFKPYNDRLSELIGRDLEHWNH